ncbi:MAG TPA: hypothetical protein VHX37_05690 [Acidobacteriaceae bacterium]|nr:hypothetical protein [Acidobacteriaceae bacterium]
MFTTRLWAASRDKWKHPLTRAALFGLYLLMTVQFVGVYLFHEYPYVDVRRFIHGYARLPFQTRLLLAPLFRWAEHSAYMVHYASRLAMNGYFFPHGIGPSEVVQFWLDIPCLLIAGWVTVRLYQAASRRHLLTWLVYPLFLGLCAVSYILHTIQNFRFFYDMPSLALFSLGLYIIYFRKPRLLLVALFALATLNRETTLFLIPFYLAAELARSRPSGPNVVSPGTLAVDDRQGRATLPILLRVLSMPVLQGLRWKRLLRPEVVITTVLLLAYWAAWHVFIFHLFRHNASDYYSRLSFNFYCLRRIRYYPQIFSACGYLLPFLIVFRKHIHDPQLRLWMWVIPGWFAVMAVWGILVETRVFGELLPVVACCTAVIAEEIFAAAVLRRHRSEVEDREETVHLVRAA